METLETIRRSALRAVAEAQLVVTSSGHDILKPQIQSLRTRYLEAKREFPARELKQVHDDAQLLLQACRPVVHPTAVILVPAGWEAVPEGLSALTTYLFRRHRAMVVVLEAPHTMSDPVFLLTGPWDDLQDLNTAQRDIENRLLPDAFFNLNWLELP